MPLLIGTDLGVFRAGDVPFDGVDRVLDAETHRVRGFEHAEGVFAATEAGLYRSLDGGETWTGLDATDRPVWSVLATPRGDLFCGTHDAHLHRSRDGGGTWEEVESFLALESRDVWASPVDDSHGRLRTLCSPPGAPDRVLAGVESGGVHVSEDAGETWEDRRRKPIEDVHRLLALGAGDLLVATGKLALEVDVHGGAPGGIYRTRDAGVSWTRLDEDSEHTYVRDLLVHDGVLYAGGSHTEPPTWRETGNQEAALFESTDMGGTFRQVSYPGEPRELVNAWTVYGGRPLGGTGGFIRDPSLRGNRSRVIGLEGDGGWRTLGTVPGNIASLEPA